MNNKNRIFSLVGIIVILITVIGLTYAFFAPQLGGTTSTNATVTSNTTDLLTFSMNQGISFTVSQADFAENGNNKSGESTATATLTPNNKTGSATMYYYLYLNIESNPIVYSSANTNQDPELMLQVFDGSNQLVTLTGLGTEKTIKGVTGYDITGVRGVKALLDNHAISATNNTATIENWRVVITLINLDVNQNDNTGKTVEGEIIIQKEEIHITDLILTVGNMPETYGKLASINTSGVTAVYNNKLNQLEISNITTDKMEGTLSFENPTGTTPLNTYILGLSGTTQGDGKLVHEIGSIPDYTNLTVVTAFGSTPEYFSNTSANSTSKTGIDSYWTFNSSTGTFTSVPSKMTASGTNNFYHAFMIVPSAGYYQICYTIEQSQSANVFLYVVKNGTIIVNFRASTTEQVGEKCYNLGYFQSGYYINISELAYVGTDSPVMTFRIEKANNIISVDTGYRYEGKNPNNYIMFNDELWRIIGVFETEYDSNNDDTIDTSDNLVKIIKEDTIGYLRYNYDILEAYYDWESATITNNTCLAAGNYTISAKCDYSVSGIQDGYRGMITNSVWYLGGSGKTGYNGNTPEFIYTYERNPDAVYNNNSASRVSNIGLMYVSDYLYSVLSSNCSRENGTNRYSTANCAGKSWLYGYAPEYTISRASNNNNVFSIQLLGDIYNNSGNGSYGYRPVLYLNNAVYRVSGTGTITDPYVIGM